MEIREGLFADSFAYLGHLCDSLVWVLFLPLRLLSKLKEPSEELVSMNFSEHLDFIDHHNLIKYVVFLTNQVNSS